MRIPFRENYTRFINRTTFLTAFLIMGIQYPKLHGQSIRETSLILYNDYLLNPADTKTDSVAQIDLIGFLYNSEPASNLKSAMLNSIISLNKLESDLRIGVYSDYDYFHSRTGATIGYAYHHNFSDNITLNLGGSSDLFKTTGFTERFNDRGLEIREENPYQYDFNIGASFSIGNFYIGNSYYSFKEYIMDRDNDFFPTYFWRLNTYYSNKITLKYKFTIGDYFQIKTLLSVATANEDESDNIGILAEYKEIIGLGVTSNGPCISAYYFHRKKYKLILQFYYDQIYSITPEKTSSVSVQLQFKF